MIEASTPPPFKSNIASLRNSGAGWCGIATLERGNGLGAAAKAQSCSRPNAMLPSRHGGEIKIRVGSIPRSLSLHDHDPPHSSTAN
jgi:hypothetical protein